MVNKKSILFGFSPSLVSWEDGVKMQQQMLRNGVVVFHLEEDV